MKETNVKKEREKARMMRKSQWWQSVIQNARCYYCETQIPRELVTMDHIVPLSRGGKSTKGNIVACCKPCNSNKTNKTASELILASLSNNT